MAYPRSLSRSSTSDPLTIQQRGLVISLLPWQREVWNHPARHKIVCAGRKSGKTELAVRWITFQALTSKIPGDNFLCFPEYKHGKSIAWYPLLKFLDEQPSKVMMTKNEQELRIDLIDNRRIWIKGTKDPNSLRGPGPTAVVLDEWAYHQNPKVWDEVIRPSLTPHRSPVLITSTPRGRNHFYQMFLLGDHLSQEGKAAEDWQSFHLKTSQAGTFDPEDLEPMLNGPTSISPEEYAQEYDAEFIGSGGLLVYAFINKRFPEGNRMPLDLWMTFKKNCTFFRTLDWGIGGFTVVTWWAADQKGRLCAFDELVVSGKTVPQISREMRSRHTELQIHFTVADRTIWRRESTQLSVAEQFQRAQIGIVPSDSHFDDSIERLNAACRSESETGDDLLDMPAFMVLEGSCKTLVKELIGVDIQDDQRQGDAKVGRQRMDAIDTARYAIMTQAMAPAVETTPKRDLAEERKPKFDLEDEDTFEPTTGFPL